MHDARFSNQDIRLDAAGSVQRQVQREGGSLSFSFAKRLDCSAMHPDQMVHNRETKSQAALAPCRISMSLSEAVKHKREERRVYSVACIGNYESGRISCAIETDGDRASRRCELDGI